MGWAGEGRVHRVVGEAGWVEVQRFLFEKGVLDCWVSGVEGGGQVEEGDRGLHWWREGGGQGGRVWLR